MRTKSPETAPAPAPAVGVHAPDTGILVEITAGLATGNDLGALLEHFLEPIVRLAGAQAGAVRVLSDCGTRLLLVSGIGLPAGVCASESTVDRHCGHCGVAADSQEMVWASDLHVCSMRTSGEFFGQGCQRLLAVPMQHRGRILGIYNLFFAGTVEPAAEILAILKSIGELLGLALNNARLEQAHLVATLTHERQVMAAEVHDSLAQSLTYVKMRLPLLKDALRAHDEARAMQYCDDVRGAVSQAHASLRSVLTHFRLPMDPKGLVHALDASAKTFRQSTGAELEFVNEMPGMRLTLEQETQVFHVVQEALTNVARHARAQRAWLRIGTSRRGEVQVVVEDDGAGLPPAVGAGSHYGLEIMNERARRLGGNLEVSARDGGGTRVLLAFPLNAVEPARTAEAGT